MKKYDLSKIMKRAWEIKKMDKRNIFGLCLKIVWAEHKLTEKNRFDFDAKPEVSLNIKGSEKQIRWCQDICDKAMTYLNDNIANMIEQTRKLNTEHFLGDIKIYKEVRTDLAHFFNNCTEASQIIDKRVTLSVKNISEYVENNANSYRKFGKRLCEKNYCVEELATTGRVNKSTTRKVAVDEIEELKNELEKHTGKEYRVYLVY